MSGVGAPAPEAWVYTLSMLEEWDYFALLRRMTQRQVRSAYRITARRLEAKP